MNQTTVFIPKRIALKISIWWIYGLIPQMILPILGPVISNLFSHIETRSIIMMFVLAAAFYFPILPLVYSLFIAKKVGYEYTKDSSETISEESIKEIQGKVLVNNVFAFFVSFTLMTLFASLGGN